MKKEKERDIQVLGQPPCYLHVCGGRLYIIFLTAELGESVHIITIC